MSDSIRRFPASKFVPVQGVLLLADMQDMERHELLLWQGRKTAETTVM